MEERRALHVLISEDAHRGYKLFARTQGITVAGFLEALGVGLLDIDQPTPFLHRVVARAKVIDAERRARGK